MRPAVAGLVLLFLPPDPDSDSAPEVPVLPVDLTRPGGYPVDLGLHFFEGLNGELAPGRRSRAR